MGGGPLSGFENLLVVPKSGTDTTRSNSGLWVVGSNPQTNTTQFLVAEGGSVLAASNQGGGVSGATRVLLTVPTKLLVPSGY